MTDFLTSLRDALAADYRVDCELGRGGMAVVYRAQDLRHDRPVAIKVMRPELTAALGPDRFLKEIQLAARLTHPRIVAVYASGDAGGVLYYVMPYVEGPTLRERLAEAGPLPMREAVRVARDVARALAYAHAHGVVHRDIKPENIMLPAGEAVVTDFGVARALTDSGPSRLTAPGFAIGTAEYMSPEQAFGRADPSADVYSLGCVLYEMLAGRPPFAGPNILAVLSSHSTSAIPRIERDDVPEPVADVVNQCLAKESENRPDATALEDTLRRAVEEPGAAAASASETVIARLGRAIAVLPLVDLSPDRAFGYLCEGVAEELLDALSRVPTLRVVSRTSAFALRDPSLDVREKARRLGAQAVLEGSVRVSGERIRVGVQLTGANDGLQLWSHRFDGTLGDVFAIEDEIARAVVDALKVGMAAPAATMIGPPTTSLDAHREYLLGRQALSRRTRTALIASVDRLAAATDLDPAFALAHAGVAEARVLQAVYGVEEPGRAMNAARAAADRALELSPGMGEALSARASVAALYDWHWADAERDFVAAIQRHPGYAVARQGYAMHLLAPLGRFADARAELDRARLVDPLSAAILTSLGQVALFSGEAAEAIGRHRSALELDPDFAPAHLFLGQAHLASNDAAAAVAALDRAAALAEPSAEVIAFQALAEGKAGKAESAAGRLAQLEAAAGSAYVSPVLIAIAQLGLGRRDQALDALERAADIRATDLVWLRVRPAFAELHATARFKALLSRLLPAPLPSVERRPHGG